MTLNLIKFFLLFLIIQNVYALEPRIYLTGHKEHFKVNDMENILEKIEREDPSKNILFYIHGRGKHPEKGLTYLPDMEKRYNVRIIMYSWPSWINFITRPVGSARLAAKNLDIALRSLNDFKQKRPHFFDQRKISFLSHSMGNIVFKVYMTTLYRKGIFGDTLFDTLTLNAPDLALFGHKNWLSKVDFSQNIYSTYNNGDAVLLGSKIIDLTRFKFFSGPRLGKALRYGFIKAKLAKNTMYLNFSKLTKGGHSHHRNKEKDKSVLNKIFKYILNGYTLPLTKSVGVKKVRGKIVYFDKK